MQRPEQEQKSILIVDDDNDIRSLLSGFLTEHQYQVCTAAGGKQAESLLAKNNIDLVVLDLMLPGEDGLSLCRRWRAQTNVPIIMLTALGDDTDRIVGLEIGADDYIAKPFNPRELLARIKAVLRRFEYAVDHTTTQPTCQILEFGQWRLDLARRELRTTDDVLVPLTAGEYDLLLAFAEHPQRVLSRDQLLDFTKGRNAGPYDRSIDVQLSRLRRKIEADVKNPKFIKTVRSGGYIFTLLVKPVP